MVWGTRGPGGFGIFNLPCIFIDKQAKSILPNDNPSRQITKYSNYYGLEDQGLGIFGINNVLCTVNDKQTDSILTNYNPNPKPQNITNNYLGDQGPRDF